MWCKGTNYNSYFRSISCIFAFHRYNYLFWRIAAEGDRNEITRRSKWKAEGDRNEKQRKIEMKKRGCRSTPSFYIMLLTNSFICCFSIAYLLFFKASIASESWSGQLVGLLPQVIPRSLAITSSASMPSTRRETPQVLPMHPPTNETS